MTGRPLTDLEVAAHAVASILRIRGVVYASDGVAMMLLDALGLDDPMRAPSPCPRPHGRAIPLLELDSLPPCTCFRPLNDP